MTTETKMKTPSAETRAALGEVLCAFEAFKEANDRRLSEIEKKAGADPLTEDKLGRIDAALSGHQQALDRLLLDARRPGLESHAAREAKSAWARYMRAGDAAALAEVKSLSAGGEGGYLAPETTQTVVDRLLAETSPIRAIASVRQTAAGHFRKPVSLGGAEAGWVAETGEREETETPDLELLEFPAFELYAMPAATTALLDDAEADIDEWLAGEVRDVFAAAETAAFIAGDGDGKPRGVLGYDAVPDAGREWGEIGYVATGAEGGFGAGPVDALIDLVYAPRPQYRANGRFLMNRRTVSAVRKLKDAEGDYIWKPSLTEAGSATLLGYPVTEAEDMPDIGADSFSIAFGDFRRGYLVVDRQGVRVLRDPYSAKPFVLFYTTKRVGGGVQDFAAIKLLKFGES